MQRRPAPVTDVPAPDATAETPADPGYYVPAPDATAETPANPGYYVPDPGDNQRNGGFSGFLRA